FFSSRRRHTISTRDWSSDVCSSDLGGGDAELERHRPHEQAQALAQPHADRDDEPAQRDEDQHGAAALDGSHGWVNRSVYLSSGLAYTPVKPLSTQTCVERILAAADRLFYAKGIRAVGVDAVAAAAGVSKRTLYNHYPSKDALIAAYLQGRFKHIAPSDAPAREQSLGASDRLERM